MKMTKRRYRTTAALLAGIMAIGMAGCGTQGGETVAETRPAQTEAIVEETVISDETPNAPQGNTGAVAEALATAVSPSPEKINVLENGEGEGLAEYWQTSMAVLLAGEDGSNRVYSPLNTYLALSMLAEITDGESRQQVLDALHAPDLETARSRARSLWEANYVDNGQAVSLLGASLWLSDQEDYDMTTVATLAEEYYASVYRGTMGSADYDAALQQWLNEQTNGLLEQAVQGQKMSPETIMALATTIYYRASWMNEFESERNTTETFHGANGDTDVTFMHQDQHDMYYWGENFTAIARTLISGGDMWLILPNEGVTAEALTVDEELMGLLNCEDPWEYENSRNTLIHESIPQFDVNSTLDLTEGMQALGITDIFDASTADFGPLLREDDKDTVLSQATHAARVKIDEEGVEAAAFTAMMAAGAAMPDGGEVDFVLDRPFLFTIVGTQGSPLFAGIVNQVG